MVVTYDGTTYSLPRASSEIRSLRTDGKLLSASSYYNPSSRLQVQTLQTYNQQLSARFHEVYLLKRAGALGDFYPDDKINGVGLVYLVNDYREESSTELPKLQTALTSLVTSPFQARLLGGEV